MDRNVAGVRNTDVVTPGRLAALTVVLLGGAAFGPLAAQAQLVPASDVPRRCW